MNLDLEVTRPGWDGNHVVGIRRVGTITRFTDPAPS